MPTLCPCPRCARHVFTEAKACPFCECRVEFEPARPLRGKILDAFECDVVVRGQASASEKGAQWLSKRRAELVRDRLLSLGAEKARVSLARPDTSKSRTEGAPNRSDGRDARVSFQLKAPSSDPPRACDPPRRPKP